MNDIISILTPSHKRPSNLLKMCKSIADTASGQVPLELLFYIDDNDHESRAVLLGLHNFPFQISIYNDSGKDSEHYNRWWNYLWAQARGTIFMQSGDDLEFKTKDWDLAIRDAFNKYPDRMAVIYCNDGSYDSCNRATHPFLSREWCNLLGYFQPTIFDGGYNDTWITEVGKACNRFVHLDGVLIDHMHVDFKKSSDDQTYQIQRDRCRQQDSRKIFQDTADLRQKHAEAIINYISNFSAK